MLASSQGETKSSTCYIQPAHWSEPGLRIKTPYDTILRCILHSYIMEKELDIDEQYISHIYSGIIRRFVSFNVNPQTVAPDEISLDTFIGMLPHYNDRAHMAHDPYPWGHFGR